jgi:hypothetical protein
MDHRGISGVAKTKIVLSLLKIAYHHHKSTKNSTKTQTNELYNGPIETRMLSNMSAPMEDVEFDVESLDVDVDVQPPTFTSTPTKTVPTSTSDISSRDDPFAPREGKTLLWRGVNMTLVGRPFSKLACLVACFVCLLASLMKSRITRLFSIVAIDLSHISTTTSFIVLLPLPFFDCVVSSPQL